MYNRHVYSEDDLNYIRQNHNRMSTSALARHCGVCHSTMSSQLKVLGLQTYNPQRPYSEADIAKLRDMAFKGKSLKVIAKALDRSEKSVQNKAREYGIVIKYLNRVWTPQEMDTLRRVWGKKPLSRISRELKRTPTAIIGKARVMKLPPCYLSSEDITLSEFCRDTGISYYSILNSFVIKYNFPLKSMKPGKRKIYHYVCIDKILQWLEENQSLYSAAGIPQYYFGVEPDWLVKKRRADMSFQTETVDGRFKAKRWTAEEVCKLRDWISHGISYEEIASRLERSESAVEHKAVREGFSYTAPKFWRGKEFKAIRLGVDTKSDEELANELGRSKKAITYHRLQTGFNRRDMRDVKVAEMLDYIKSNWPNVSDAECAEKYGFTKGWVRQLRCRAGFKRIIR